MNIEIENGVTFFEGDGVAEAFLTIVNLLCNSTSPEQFGETLALMDKVQNLGKFFKWGFGAGGFWVCASVGVCLFAGQAAFAEGVCAIE